MVSRRTEQLICNMEQNLSTCEVAIEPELNLVMIRHFWRSLVAMWAPADNLLVVFRLHYSAPSPSVCMKPTHPRLYYSTI